MLNFEDKLKELEGIVVKMEDKNTSLDDNLKLFTDGAKLVAGCMEILKQSKGRVEEVVKEIEGLTKIEIGSGE